MKSLLVVVIFYHHDNEAADIAVFLHQPSKDDQSTWAWGGRRGLCGSHQILLRHHLLSLAFYVTHKREEKTSRNKEVKGDIDNIYPFQSVGVARTPPYTSLVYSSGCKIVHN